MGVTVVSLRLKPVRTDSEGGSLLLVGTALPGIDGEGPCFLCGFRLTVLWSEDGPTRSTFRDALERRRRFLLVDDAFLRQHGIPV